MGGCDIGIAEGDATGVLPNRGTNGHKYGTVTRRVVGGSDTGAANGAGIIGQEEGTVTAAHVGKSDIGAADGDATRHIRW